MNANRLIAITLGLLLLATAGLKLYGLNVTPVPQIGGFSAPWVQVAAVEWESLLGLWLLSGRYKVGAWWAAVVTFLTFTGISGYLGWIGQAHCGCFGTIEASPWVACAVDGAVLVALAFGRPTSRSPGVSSLHELAGMSSGVVKLVAGTLLVLGVLVGAATWVCGSPEAALAWLRGDAVTVVPGYVEMGEGKRGQDLEASVEVRNWTDQPVRLIGGTSDCSCVVTRDLPLTVQPREAKAVTIRLKLRTTETGAFTRTAELWTDCDRQRSVWLVLGARVGG